MKNEATATGFGFDPFRQRPKSDAASMKTRHALDQMFERPSESIESPNDERVTRPKMSQCLVQSVSVCGSAARDVREYFLTACCRERVLLEFEILVMSRDAGVADQHGRELPCSLFFPIVSIAILATEF
jgi:hypothetical protein